MARGTNRILVAGVGLVAAAAVLVGCSDDKGSSPAPSTAAASGTGSSTQVSTEPATPRSRWRARILAGLDLNSVTCVKVAGKINVASAPIGGGAQGLGLVMTDEATPKVEYTSRLWPARLHGRDVWQEPCDDVDEVRALLEGVARSHISLDHRQRIKAMLELEAAR